jgi:hypothetical protein
MAVQKVVKKNAVLLVLLVVVVAVTWFFAGHSKRSGKVADLENYPDSTQVKYSFRLQNTTHRKLSRAEVRAWTFVAKNPAQLTTNLETEAEHKLLRDDLGNQVMYFQYLEIPSDASPTITVNANLAFAKKPNPRTEPSIDQYIKNDSFLEIQAEQIRELASQLKAENSENTIGNILGWFKNNISTTVSSASDHNISSNFASQPLNSSSDQPPPASNTLQPAETQNLQASEEIPEPISEQVEDLPRQMSNGNSQNVTPKFSTKKSEKSSEEIEAVALEQKGNSALDVLEKRHSSTTGDLYLFVALCRAAQIPVRGAIGFVWNNKLLDEVTKEDITVWAEYYDAGTWQTIDLTAKEVVKDFTQSKYVTMRYIESFDRPAGQVPYELLFETVGLNFVPGSLRVRIGEFER